MRRILVAVAVAASFATACASGPQVSSSRGGNATLLGVVAVPESAQGQANACDGLGITAALAEDSNILVGRAVVRQSRGRCSYQISGLPSGQELKLNVQAPASWTCANGSQVTVAPNDTVKLSNMESRNRDLSAACSAS
ncbi:hypothetical protein FGE12_19930 [Aggregicoccus sp. 17bor-14]|uniref:hypothetical protein n=1 Tax=Myxococcaceae TaxID=31 RepID=UPI00129C1214|nr:MULTISPECIES: hypothetical protein [Myxococcaceae]MBF5044680.1 hypothetical protein [Simulacricoccus sp. 17bor-14]MRI90424.1 hypothetical protein [Aggregicoccus sp. 17bor-14]